MPQTSRARSHRSLILAGAFLGAALGVLAVPASAQDTAPPDSASTRQIELGEQWFRAACFECHANGTLTSADFRLKWNGRSAFELFESIRSTMPESAPGSLAQGTYVAVVAYLVRTNGMPVGTSALPADSAGLSAVRLTFAPAASTSRR